ncbi:hypothetical protein QBC42DRAFT_108335 [Cladorrhinum samala]|uniref:Uncharacterized protein n=1 Tax=Cladorrhinum samala TaxID=585594 RepID=A0AAV9I4D4_9PEZI|nr:hypothetical protein QBC42DRAFT_108335 [Cladorrhinum samala]
MAASASHHHKAKPDITEIPCCEALSGLASSHETCSQGKIPKSLKRCFYRAGPIFFKLLTVATFLLTILALWPSIESAADTRRSTGLAEWTSKKEFIEFCEEHSWHGHQCEDVKGYELGPPPGFWPRLLRGRGLVARMMYPKVVKSGISEAGSEGLAWLKDVDEEAEGGSCVNELGLARRSLLGPRQCQVQQQNKVS